MSLPSKYRLGRFTATYFADSQKSHGLFFTVLRKNIQEQETKIAISVSKKVSKKSHIRNKLRRLTSSGLSQFLKTIPAGHYLVLPNFKVASEPFFRLKQDLEKIFFAYSK